MPTFTDRFIERPVLAMVVSLLILLLGLQAFAQLSVREYPKIESTQITITTSYPGASPEAVRSFITTPLGQAVASAEGVDTISTSSTQGLSRITIQLFLDANPDRAVTDVMTKVNQVRFLLPREAFDPVVSREDQTTSQQMYIDFSSSTLTPSQITDYILRVAQPAIQSVPGVGQAVVLGSQTFAMRIWLKPDRMAALEVTATDVRDALLRNNFTSAPGTVKGDYIEATVDARTSLSSVAEFRQLVVASRNGALVRLADVATVELGPEAALYSSFSKGKRAIFVGVSTIPGGNPLDVLPRVHERIAELQSGKPPGLTMEVGWDSSTYIREAVLEVGITVVEATLIVIVVIFLFLGSVRTTLIPIITIPLSLIGVLFLLQVLGYSINLLTLLALVLAIGLVVDDAIVVVENIARHIEEGMAPKQAAITGAREIALPVVGITLTLAAVYAPIAFVDGLTGKLFREFAFTLAAAVVISGIIALTLAPMMCARLLKPVDHHAKAEGRSALRALASRLVHIIDSRFERLKLSYQRTLDASLNVRWAAGAIGVMLLAASLMFYQKTPKELAPDEDQGFVFMLFSAPQWGNLDYLDHYVQRMDDIFKTFPEYETSFLINGDGSNTTSGFGGMTLKPWSERERSTADIVPELAGKLRALTGIDVFATADTFLPGTGGGLPVQVVIRSQGDFEALAQAAEALETAAMTSGYFIFADNSLTFDKPAIDVDIDRTKASQMGVSMADIGDTLATLLGGNYVNLFEMEGRSYRVVPQVARVDRLTPELLGSYYVRAASGALVPLSTFVTLTRTVQPNALTTFQQLNSATIAGVPYPGRTTGEAVAFLERAAADILPPGMSLDYAGETRQFKQEGARLGLTFGFAMLIIFLVLAAQFESFRDPVIVLVSVPLSLAGALLALNIGSFLQVPGATINIYTQIGLITLAGLISKHGILMVDFANHLQRQFGYDRRQAIVEAAAIRLRPILMTTAAMVAGVLPLLLATGPGANSRFAIGLVIAAGLTIGTLLTLFIVPAVYTWLAADHREPAKDSTGSAALGDSGAVAQPAE